MLKRALSFVGDRFLPRGVVAEVNEVSENFRFIDLESDAFRTATLDSGTKIQIDTGEWDFRTYTPLTVNRELGRLGILVYVHGSGTGALWAANAKPGDSFRFFGPRASLRITSVETPLVFFGDETAIATAASFQRRAGSPRLKKIILEASSPTEVETIVRDLGLRNVEVYPKDSAGNLARDIARSILESSPDPTKVVLSGSAESVRQIRGRLRDVGFPMATIRAKAYWAEGKVGLD